MLSHFACLVVTPNFNSTGMLGVRKAHHWWRRKQHTGVKIEPLRMSPQILLACMLHAWWNELAHQCHPKLSLLVCMLSLLFACLVVTQKNNSKCTGMLGVKKAHHWWRKGGSNILELKLLTKNVLQNESAHQCHPKLSLLACSVSLHACWSPQTLTLLAPLMKKEAWSSMRWESWSIMHQTQHEHLTLLTPAGYIFFFFSEDACCYLLIFLVVVVEVYHIICKRHEIGVTYNFHFLHSTNHMYSISLGWQSCFDLLHHNCWLPMVHSIQQCILMVVCCRCGRSRTCGFELSLHPYTLEERTTDY